MGFSKQAQRRGEKQDGFDFLGFTFYLGRSRRGAVIPKLKTSGKRLRSKLKRMGEWARKVRNVLPQKNYGTCSLPSCGDTSSTMRCRSMARR